MARTLAFFYGVVSYVVFFVTFLYAIGFVDSTLAVLQSAQASGKPVRVNLAPDSDDIIEGVEQVE